MSKNKETLPDAFSAGDFAREGEKFQKLVNEIEALPDLAARRLLHECLESVLSLHGRGLERMLELADEKTAHAFLHDPGVRGLLLIHGLHPVPLETRLREALDTVRPYMESHGGNVELVSLENDFARLRLQGHCQTCPSSTVTLELAVRAAIEEACPDLQGFEVEGIARPETLDHLPKAAPQWKEIEGADGLANGQWMQASPGSESLLICKLDDRLYAYGDRCPACNMPLHLGEMRGGNAVCNLGHAYDLRHAGAGLNRDGLHLDPFPLVTKDGVVKVALAAERNHSTPVAA